MIIRASCLHPSQWYGLLDVGVDGMLNLFGWKLKRGEKLLGQVKVAEFPDGTPVSIVVRAVCGSSDGPTISMLGVQHGDEYSGMEIVNRLVDETMPEEIAGSIVAIPVANPLAFNVAGRMAPESMGYENLNMNRVWPGDRRGLLTERIAAAVWENVILGSDYVIDFHEGGKAFIARYIHARDTQEVYELVGNRIEKLYRLFGQGIPVLGGVGTRGSMLGSLSVQAGLRGIPCIGPELGGGGRIWEEHVQTGVRGARNIMIGLGMLQREPVGATLEQVVVEESTWPKTEHGGVIYNACELGDKVVEGEELGVLKDTAGRTLEEVRAPYDSIILDVRHQPTIYPGDWTYHCGRLR